MLAMLFFVTSQVFSPMLATFLRKRVSKHLSLTNLLRLLKAAVTLAVRLVLGGKK